MAYTQMKSAALADATKSENWTTIQGEYNVLLGAFIRGAGLNGAVIGSSGPEGDINIPARDIALQTDALKLQYHPINRRYKASSQLSLTPDCIGTADYHAYLFWGRTPYPWEKMSLPWDTQKPTAYVYMTGSITGAATHAAPRKLGSIATEYMLEEGSRLIPSEIVAAYVCGEDLEHIQVNTGKVDRGFIPCVDVAINTNVEPFKYVPVHIPVIPGTDVDLTEIDHGTGTADEISAWFVIQ